MQAHRRHEIWAIPLAVTYAGFIAADIALPALSGMVNSIKLACIIFCLLLSMGNPSMDGMLASVALAFSLLADYLLMYTSALVAGVVCFCCVHLLHIRRLRPSLSYAFLVGTAILLGLSFALLNGRLSLLIGVCAIYSALLCSALVFALRQPAFGLGMLAFAFCDICVAIHYLAAGPVAHVAFLLIWPLYIPAQLLLIRPAAPAFVHAGL